MPRGLARPRFSASNLFGLKAKRTSVYQEVLAGILGWQTIVTSFEFYAGLLVGNDDDVDSNATLEMFLLVAGTSTLAYGLLFNVPFIVAPSVLYAAREPGITIGGHLAAQATANLAVAFVFSLALKTSFVSYIPTALRLGAGCGLSILVSVLGMRGVGLLVADSFALQPPSWETIIGLCTITGACCKVLKQANTKKWTMVVLIPSVLTLIIYAITDRSKYRVNYSPGGVPLANWRSGTFGTVDVWQLSAQSRKIWFYIVRLFLSVSINVSSVLLVLIDAVCLEEVHTKVKSSEEVDFSNDIGGTKKFRSMACAIPLMSFVGNLMGVTTQAAFVQTMMPVFAGGKTGLSSVVTGGLLIMSTVLRPLLPLLVPPHVSGALAVVISLRFFTVITMIDVHQPTNLLMFGMSILLIPFSFEFVDALCVTTMLSFLCQTLDTVVARLGSRHGKKNKIVVSVGGDHTYGLDDAEGGEPTAETVPYDTSHSTSHKGVRRSSKRSARARRQRTSQISPDLVLPLGGRSSSGQAVPGEAVAQEPLAPQPSLPTSPAVPISVRSRFPSSCAGSSRSEKVYQASLPSPLMPGERARPARTAKVHWCLALVASCELALTAIDNHLLNDDDG